MTLEQTKINYAKKKGFDTWTRYINDQPNYMVEQIMDDICRTYSISILESFIKEITLKEKEDELWLMPCIDKKSFLLSLGENKAPTES